MISMNLTCEPPQSHIWTFQPKNRYKELQKNGLIKSTWKNKKIKKTGSNDIAYECLLSFYNHVFHKRCNGLFFTHISMKSDKGSTIDTVSDLYNVLAKLGWPSGSFFSFDTHYLLELYVPNDINKLIFDFYRFSDLLYYLRKTEDGNYYSEIKAVITDFFKPNCGDKFELGNAVIPEIRNEWVKNVYENW